MFENSLKKPYIAGMTWKVAAFYRFTGLESLTALRHDIRAFCREREVCGTILLAPEGINGTIAAAPDDLDRTVEFLDGLAGIGAGEIKFSAAAEKPFARMKVRLKKEIITLKAPEANPALRAGVYVDPARWNDLIADPDVLLLDTRNDYETEAGVFRGAVDPRIKSFTQFKAFAEKELDPAKHRKIAMYCTGGIRCEKASSYLLARGFEEVYHLKGGILKYLEEMPEEKSLWTGSCFVFDERRALGHGLREEKA